MDRIKFRIDVSDPIKRESMRQLEDLYESRSSICGIPGIIMDLKDDHQPISARKPGLLA